MAHLTTELAQSIAKMNTRQLGELFVEACKYDKIRSIVVPCSATKSLDGKIKQMINWKINQKYTSIINFGNLNDYIIRLMVYAQRAASTKSTSKQESSKANIIKQTVMNNINILVQKLDDMKSNVEQSCDKSIDHINEELEIERNILQTLHKKSESSDKKNILDDTQKVKTLAQTVYKILREDTPMADRLYREINIFLRPARDTTQDTGGSYRLANSDRDRRFKASTINSKFDRTTNTNWRENKTSSKTMTFDNKPKNSSIYRPKLQDNANLEQISKGRSSGSVYQPPLTEKKHYGQSMNDGASFEKPHTPRTSTIPSKNTYIPPHMRNALPERSNVRNQNGRYGNTEFINFDDIHLKNGFNIELNDFPELGSMKKQQSSGSKPHTNKQENNITSMPEGRFGVLDTDDSGEDGIDWEDDEVIMPKSMPTTASAKAPSIWGSSKSFVAIAKEAEETCRIRKEETDRLIQEVNTRLLEEKKRNAWDHADNPFSSKKKQTIDADEYEPHKDEPNEEEVYESETYEYEEDW